ncbi:fas apoptotic inhibitory molecule 1 [Anthonomus grandis grandis]|uniref:fas apoptotic inhibitory molecule 1 n=1 Tax=Anthonomus grandis grandis TaxID=2921223 RepID=UPI002165C01D|nr:fas apoptotic inhibitory molecule 1 [Anthonomus grandis grandis]
MSQTSATLKKSNSQDRSDVVAYWSVPLLDGAHLVEFEHGTTTGKRVLRIDGKEVLRKDWMFKLVGDIRFKLGKQEANCELRVDPIPPFYFTYALWVDGKPLQKFLDKQSESIRSWSVVLEGKRYFVALERQTLEIWLNGLPVEVERDFVDGGTEMRFKINDLDAAMRSNRGAKEISYDLFIDNRLIMDNNDA